MGKIERIELPAGRIVSIKLREDGTYELLFEVEEQKSDAKIEVEANVPEPDVKIEVEANVPEPDVKIEVEADAPEPDVKIEVEADAPEPDVEIEVEADAPETDVEKPNVFSESEIGASKLVLIEASKLSMHDDFMQYQPKTYWAEKLKYSLEAVIKKGIADFWRPRMDPTLDKTGNIYFKLGEKPAVGKSYNWWRDNAKKFNTKRNSRLGTKSQYIAFLGVLIKTLVAEGWDIDEAWFAVCNDSRKLGHYRNSVEAKHDFEPTGSRAIAGFYDLANTCKILAEDEDTDVYLLASGSCKGISDGSTLSCVTHCIDCNYGLSNSVGWLVLS